MATCTYQSPLGYRCPLEEADATGLCILHSKNESKDRAAFLAALRGKVQRDNEDTGAREIRLDGVVFPGPLVWWAVVTDMRPTAKPLSFSWVAFSEKADFSWVTFTWEAYFKKATFSGNADFSGATFTGDAVFLGATFSGSADFRGANFTRDAVFWGATFKGRTLFQHTTFPTKEEQGWVSFQELAIEKPEEFFFEDVALSRTSFLRTNLTKVQFTDVTWATKPERVLPSWAHNILVSVFRRLPPKAQRVTRLLRVEHNVLYDHLEMEREEKSHKEKGTAPTQNRAITPGEGEEGRADRQQRETQNKARLVANLYRQLRLNYESSRQEGEAGHFYIGQMDMRRRDPDTVGFTRLALASYRAVAMYGESAWRPLILYFLFSFLLFAPLYLFAGFSWGDPPQSVSYVLTWHGTLFPFGGDYLKAWYLSVTAGTLLRGNVQVIADWGLVLAYVNMVWDIFLISLFLIALRRHFRR